MDDAVKYEIGSGVRCIDGDCGELLQVVVDPVARKLTHLIVTPTPAGDPRIVPIGLATPTGTGISLACTSAEFEALEAAMRTHFLPAEEQDPGQAHDRTVAWPFFGLAPGGPGLALGAPEPIMVPAVELEDRTPAGEVEIRRGDRVHAADGAIGHVRGLVVDPADDRVTHVLLDEGHLWGHKQVAIPMSVVTVSEGGGVAVRLRKDEIKHLPSVDVDLGVDG